MGGNLAVQATVVSEEGCFFEFRDGLFYAHDPSLGVVRAMRPFALYKTFQRAALAIQEYHAREGVDLTAEIIPFPTRAA